MVRLFKNSPRVIHAQPNYIYQVSENPNDPLFGLQWGLEQLTDEDIDAATAWDIQTGSYSIKIGIFDTGIDYGHDDLGNAFGLGWKVVGGYDWVNNDSDPRDDHYHGTHVAGIAGALTNNTSNGHYVGVAGIAGGWGYERSTNAGNKGAQLFAMKIGDAYGGINTARAANAIVEGADPDGDGWGYGIHVLNNSWGGYQYDETLRSAVNYAARMNRVFVAAKGNDDTNQLHYPSDYDGSWVISVGATDQLGRRVSTSLGYPWGSNHGNGIDVVAPGYGIYSTMPTYTTTGMSNRGYSTNYEYVGGTSMAAPHVAGLAALILSQKSNLHPEDVQGIIRASSEDKDVLGYDEYYGAGRINAGRALQYMQSPWVLENKSASGGTAVSNTGTYQAIFYNTGGGLPTGTYIVKRYEVRKTVSFSVSYSSTPYVWGRGANATVGWSAANPNYQTGYCNVVSSSGTSAELQTFVYEVWNLAGQYLGWYPTSPSNVSFAYTILAPMTVAITGPTELQWKQQGTWTANATGGTGTYSYEWRWRDYPGGSWSAVVSTTNLYSRQMPNNNIELQVKVSSGGVDVYDTHIVWLSGSPKQVFTGSVQIETAREIPQDFALSQNRPNPFNPETQITFALPEASTVRLSVFDLLGREVAVLENRILPAGYRTVRWNGRNSNGESVGSGVYFYRITAVGESGKTFTQTMKMLMAK